MRPALITALDRFGAYPYGPEKSYTAGQLRALAEGAGFQVHDITGLLFMPGALRMLDLFLQTLWPPAAVVTALPVGLFAAAYRLIPPLRRHGYLIAAIAEKPA